MAEKGKNQMPRIGIAALNLTGLGLGYLLLKNWKRWAIHFAGLIALILLATFSHASAQPALWILVFVLFFLWMAFDGWRLAGKENTLLPGQLVKSPWILIALTALILAGEVLGFLWFQSSARSVYQSAVSEMKSENYPAAASLFNKVVSVYQLSFDPLVVQAAEKYQEVIFLVNASDAYQQGQFESAIRQYDQYLKDYPRSSQVKAVQNQIASVYRDWGLSLQKQAKYEEALEKYATALQLYPTAPVISHFYEERAALNLQLARQQVENSDYLSGIKTYQIIFNSFPRSAAFSQASAEIPAVYFRYAQAEESKGNYDSALESLNRILTDYPAASVADRARDFLPEVKLKKASLLIEQSHFLDALFLLDEIMDVKQTEAFLAKVSEQKQSGIDLLARDRGKDGASIIQLAKNMACGNENGEVSGLDSLIPQVVGIFKDEPAKVDVCDNISLNLEFIMLDTEIQIPIDKKVDIPGTFRYVIQRDYGKERIQSCNYTGGHKLERMRYTLGLSLVDVISGKTVVKTKLIGSNPPVCPQRRAFAVKTEQIYGNYVTDAQVQAWILKVLK